MKNRYRLIRRGNRSKSFYCVDSETGSRTSLGKISRDEAEQIVGHKNTALRQPMLNLQIAKAYLAGTDSGVNTRTWGNALQSLIDMKTGGNRKRWATVLKDKALKPLFPRVLIETQAEELLNCIKTGTISTNIFLRRLHNFCLDTGFRISEILSLNLEDVVEGSGIRNSVTVKKAFMKGKKENRTMPLHIRAQSAIRDLLASLPCQSGSEKTPLFRSQGTEKRLSVRMYSLQLKGAARAAGISCEHLATHTMRKTFASRMWSSPFIRQDLAKMANLLGHRDPANTLRYIQFLDNSLASAVLAA
jgi:site-specific recombinase XerD